MSVGRFCIVGEKAIVGGPAPAKEAAEGGEPGKEGQDTVLSDGVTVEPGALIVSSARIGEYSSIGALANVHAGAVVGRWCKIAALCEVRAGEVLEDFTVVFGAGERRVDGVFKAREEVRAQRMRARGEEARLLGSLVMDGGAKWRG